MIDKIKKKNKQNQRRQRHATILPKCWKTYCLNMKIRMKKKKIHTRKKNPKRSRKQEEFNDNSRGIIEEKR